MVQLQLCSLDQLSGSGFGRPFPRHGLQLLFWFANDCVSCEPVNVMKLVSDCQPEKGFYGFHVFGNVEELLPALSKKRKNKKQVSYFEVGNLNTDTYPASADLPAYVRENYGLDGNYGDDNSDRIIISYQARTRLVEAVYVTEHDDDAFGRFRADRTFEVSCDLIRVLQNQQLDVSSLLVQMGYYDDTEETQHPGPSVQEMFDIMQTFSRDGFFSGAFDQFMDPFSFGQQWTSDTTPSSSRTVARCSQVKPKRSKTKKKNRAVRRIYQEPSYEQPYNWEQPYSYHQPYSYDQTYTYDRSYSYEEPYSYDDLYRVFAGKPKKKKDGGGGFFRILLGAGALYLAFRCFSWLLSSYKTWDMRWSDVKHFKKLVELLKF